MVEGWWIILPMALALLAFAVYVMLIEPVAGALMVLLIFGFVGNMPWLLLSAVFFWTLWFEAIKQRVRERRAMEEAWERFFGCVG